MRDRIFGKDGRMVRQDTGSFSSLSSNYNNLSHHQMPTPTKSQPKIKKKPVMKAPASKKTKTVMKAAAAFKKGVSS